jgi:alkanesulfonate monooxygenase SsuD/methylene tetrahydromethanopterin reductase-like flavin-dependent oxidoreductase (luciferase family)
MRVSLCLDPGRSWPHVVTLAQRADLAGWHAVYVCDHFMPNDPAGRPAAGPMMECWMVLAALAERTATVALGSLVLGNTYRHPAVVADMAATLDQISHGRLVLGIGAGWQPNEHAAYGIPLPSARDRVAALDEACAVIRSRLNQQPAAAGRTACRSREEPGDPEPRVRLPLLVAGGGRGILKVAARHADIWHTWADPAEFACKNALLDAFGQEAGRRPADIVRACGASVTVHTSRNSHLAASNSDVRGTAQEVLSQLLAFRDAGAGEFIVRDDAHVPLEQALRQLDTLTTAVLPRLA